MTRFKRKAHDWNPHDHYYRASGDLRCPLCNKIFDIPVEPVFKITKKK